MSWGHVLAVLHMKDSPRWLSVGEFGVLLMLADEIRQGTTCWPSKVTLARRLRMSEKGVFNALRRLEKEGLIAIYVGGQAGRPRVTWYELLFPPVEAKKGRGATHAHAARVAAQTHAHAARVAAQTHAPVARVEPLEHRLSRERYGPMKFGRPVQTEHPTRAKSDDDPCKIEQPTHATIARYPCTDPCTDPDEIHISGLQPPMTLAPSAPSPRTEQSTEITAEERAVMLADLKRKLRRPVSIEGAASNAEV